MPNPMPAPKLNQNAMMKPETHYLGQETFNVSKCNECGRNAVCRVQLYYSKARVDWLRHNLELPVLPKFDADDLCDCDQNDENED